MIRNLITTFFVTAIVFIIAVPTLAQRADDTSTASSKPTTDTVGSALLPTGRLIRPAGQSIAFHGRPVDLCLSHDDRRLFVKDRNHLRVIDVEGDAFALKQSLDCPNGASLFGIATAKNGDVYVTSAKNDLHVYSADEKDEYKLARTISLPKDSFPCGIALIDDDSQALVCLSKANQLAIVDLATDTVAKRIDVGVAPFAVATTADEKQAIVSNIGGRRATEADETATSGGTETVVDKRGIANTGTVHVVDIANGKTTKEVAVGLHPSVVHRTKNAFLVCNANDDSLSRLSQPTFEHTNLVVKPDLSLPFGSMPSAVTSSPDGSQIFVALAGNNAIACLSSWPDRENEKPPITGLVPTGWYPSALACNKKHLFIANIKGNGARAQRREEAKGHNSHDHQGTIQRVALADILDEQKLAELTKQVRSNSRIPQILRSRLVAESSTDESTKPVPLPKKLGQPSLFKHVIYVIKENRTFDQVFGDIEEARSEPKLCVFPERVTPNHHALARQFGILDNYYCNGVLSADGHSWATEGNVTPYLERAFGGFARSYTFGDDPITYSSSGFFWDHILAAGLSFRNYGEMDYAKPPEEMKYQEVFAAHKDGKSLQFTQQMGIERLRRYSCRDYPGWNMMIPDVLRMDRFLKEFRAFEKSGGMPNMMLLYLPQDHLGGGVTSNAHMADNDLALGRLVEAVSNSKYWPETLIVVNEDDPQNGYDHIDGHRSLCLVISAYSRPGVNHHFYNQTSALRTMLHVFGLPPMNQQDGSAPLMHECFADEALQKPYKARPANIALNEKPKPPERQSQKEKEWRRILATVPIERTGMKSPQDEDNLNRFIWHEVRGWDEPYPVELAGAHATGLRRLGLVIDADADD